MAAVKHMKGRTKVPRGARKRTYASPVDKAKGWEINWKTVAPVFEATRHVGNCCYVYAIAEADDGPVKIGHSKDPIARLRTMQTGNPRRLRIEHVIVGGLNTEKFLHEVWLEYAITSANPRTKLPEAAPGTEWFRSAAREKLLPVMASASTFQVEYIEETSGTDISQSVLNEALRRAHGVHEVEMRGRDVVWFLAATGSAPAKHHEGSYVVSRAA